MYLKLTEEINSTIIDFDTLNILLISFKFIHTQYLIIFTILQISMKWN